MSDSEDSTVTYTQISSPFADLSNIGPPSPNYVPGLEEPQAPLPLDFVPEPVYLEFMPPDDESDPEEDPEEDDEDPEEDPADYPADRDYDDDEEEEGPFRDDADDEDEDEDKDEEEEEEHPALADSVPPVHRMTARISIRDEPFISMGHPYIPQPTLKSTLLYVFKVK
ncbi:hypothetical protein Tco_1378978 [Tanacetum coccineum]